ncbi:MAG: conjugal transfer protein TraD [Bacillota bacterium]|jgi:hypothetical protein
MRKPRDYDAELKSLDEKARQLKARKVQQLGELVVACGADSLSPDHLAGALLGIAEVKDAAAKEGWRKRGVAFFQRSSRKAPSNPGGKSTGTLPL